MNTQKVDLSRALSRRYKMWTLRRGDKDVRTVVSTIPYEVVEREARSVGLSVIDFLEKYEAEFLYDSFDGLHIRFVIARQKEESLHEAKPVS